MTQAGMMAFCLQKPVTMILYEPTIPVRYAAPLLDAVANLPPGELSPALACAGIGEAVFRLPDQILTCSQFDTLLNVLSGG